MSFVLDKREQTAAGSEISGCGTITSIINIITIVSIAGRRSTFTMWPETSNGQQPNETNVGALLMNNWRSHWFTIAITEHRTCCSNILNGVRVQSSAVLARMLVRRPGTTTARWKIIGKKQQDEGLRMFGEETGQKTSSRGCCWRKLGKFRLTQMVNKSYSVPPSVSV